MQDLTGQVIKKMMDVIEEMDTQLLQLLIGNARSEKREAIGSLLNSPQPRQGPPDAAADQGLMDDLLASLWF
ncbi:MAG: protein phosphatase CheZ [Betaproteobacteria bacterium]